MRLVLLVLCAFWLTPGLRLAAEETPDHKVADFYRWYITENDEAGANTKSTLPFLNPNISKYVTHSLESRISSAYKAGHYDDLAGGADYFYHTQDTGENWASTVRARTVRDSGSTALVQTTIGNQNDFLVHLCVRLRKEADAWRVYQVDDHAIANPPAGCRSN